MGSMKKADTSTDRKTLEGFQQIVNIGPALEADFRSINLNSPQDLIDQDPLELYQQLCHSQRLFHDPCVLDCFMAAVSYMNGNAPQTWWKFTAERKKRYANEVNELRQQYSRTQDH